MAIRHTTAADGTFSASGATAWDAVHGIDNDTLVAAKLSATAACVFGATAAGAGVEKGLTGTGNVVLATAPTITGEVLAAGSTTVAPLTFTSGTNLTTPAAGAAEYDGTVYYITPVANNRGVNTCAHFLCQNANRTGSDVNTAQQIFDEAANGAITLAGSTTYEFEVFFTMTRSAGTTAHTTGTLFGGTAVLTSIHYQSACNTNTSAAAQSALMGHATSAAAYTVSASSSSATENIRIRLRGIVRVDQSGTFIPQFQYSAAPGGAPTILANSYARFIPWGSNTVGTVGNWS